MNELAIRRARLGTGNVLFDEVPDLHDFELRGQHERRVLELTIDRETADENAPSRSARQSGGVRPHHEPFEVNPRPGPDRLKIRQIGGGFAAREPVRPDLYQVP